MRGFLRTDQYFVDTLKKSDDNLSFMENLLAASIAKNGENSPGVKNGLGFLCGEYQIRLRLLYTTGTQDGNLKDNFLTLLKYYSEIWEKENSYFNLIEVLSNAILMNVGKENQNLAQLLEKIKDADYRDYLVDRFIQYIDPSWEHNCQEFLWKDTFEPLKQVFDCPKDEAIMRIRDFLQNEWYDIHADCGWYDTHKSMKTEYDGYWSFETAAIVKMLGLDDSKMKDQQYYPYDLVHMVFDKP